MKKWLVMTRGAPGSGKSTFLREKGLSKYTINPDMIRAEQAGLYMDEDGIEQRGFVDEASVWRQVELDVRERMEKSEPVIIDATFQQLRDFKMPAKLANQFKYSPAVLDFTKVSQQTAISRNSKRQGWAKVPEEVISTAYERFRKNAIGKGLLVVDFEDFENSALYFALT